MRGATKALPATSSMEFYNLAADRQHRAYYEVVRAHLFFSTLKVERQNSILSDAGLPMLKAPGVGLQLGVYNPPRLQVCQ